MGYATYVGRIGALAVALGVGAALTSSPAMAWPDKRDDRTSSASDPQSTS